jgi:hypothetical protein
MAKKRRAKRSKGAMAMWRGKVPADGSVMGQPPNPPRRGPSAAKVLRSGTRSMLSAGTPGNEETDP